MTKHILSITVGNIGEVFKTSKRKEASDIFRHYCDASDSFQGKAAGEDVALLRDGEPILEHQGLLSRLAEIDAGFMVSDIQQGDFWEIETRHGTCILPGDLVSLDAPFYERETDIGGSLGAFLDYIPESCGSCKLEDIISAERKTGWGARLSAPGYLDCTEWSLFETEGEAIAYIVETYGDEFQGDDDDGEEGEGEHS